MSDSPRPATDLIEDTHRLLEKILPDTEKEELRAEIESLRARLEAMEPVVEAVKGAAVWVEKTGAGIGFVRLGKARWEKIETAAARALVPDTPSLDGKP